MTVVVLGIVAALLTGIAILGPAAPALGASRTRRAPVDGDSDERRITVLRALRDLEADRSRGALSNADYEALRSRLETQAIKLLRQSTAQDAVLEISSAVRASRSGALGKLGNGRQTHPRHRRKGASTRSRQVAPTAKPRTWITGAAISAVLALGVLTVLAGAVSARSPGGFITGGTPAAATDPATLVANNPTNVEARLELAQQDLETGKMSDATNQYLAVVKLDPKNPEARTRLALLLYESGDSQEALKGVDAVLADDPTWPEALFIKGVVLLNGLNRPHDAIAPLEQYLQVDPNGPYSPDAMQLLQQARGS